MPTASTAPLRGLLAAAALPLLLSATGCVSQQNADKWREKTRATEEYVLDLRSQIEDRDAEIAVLRGKANPNPALQGQLSQLEQQNQQLRDALRAAEDQLLNAGPTALPARLTSELEQLAAANPDLMTFDPDTGLIRFRSDVTFALGKIDLQPQAKTLITQLAGVLTGPAARSYEVRVAGHTDNVPVKNTANKQRFEDNWGLSAFRAKRVMEALRQAGVPEARMSILGYGQQRPVVANGPRGAEANRRVELFLVPISGAATPPPASSETSSSGGDAEPVESPTQRSPADLTDNVSKGDPPSNTPAMFK